MSKELIKITENNGIETVNARELHEYLGSQERFSKWFSRMLGYGFEEDVDYTPYRKVHPQNQQEIQEYYVSIDMAKELSMLARNDRGRGARKYFISREKQAIELSKRKIPDFNNPVEAARAWADAEEKRLEAENSLEEAKPKITLAETALRDKEKQYSIRDAGKHLGLHQSEIFEIMRNKRLLTTRDLPTQKALNEGVLSIKSSPDRKGKNRPQAVMTMENIMKFNERYNKFELKG